MDRKHFIALADMIREFNTSYNVQRGYPFDQQQLEALANFCKSQNPKFKRERWLACIAGHCGPNGGKNS